METNNLLGEVSLKPLLLAEARIKAVQGESDETLLTNLLYAAELVVKMAVAGMAAGIHRDTDRHQYRHYYKLVRADGIGVWTQELNALLTGPTAQYLNAEMHIEQQELIQRTKKEDEWQYQAVRLMHQALQAVYPAAESLPKAVMGWAWFDLFARLRNKTRGHGAVTPAQAKAAVEPLQESLKLFIQYFSLFKRPWVHLRRTQSSKYNVTWLNGEAENHDYIRKLAGSAGLSVTLEDGIYIWLDGLHRVGLAWYDEEEEQLFFPNGQFTEKRFDVLSYDRNKVMHIESAPFLLPPGPLPNSETQGLAQLDVLQGSFSNLPPQTQFYIDRPDLQEEISSTLTNPHRYSVVILHGRGGIGKTSLALKVLHEIDAQEQYECILWFSARDIDLLPEGPKLVKAHLVSEADMAEEYNRLAHPSTILKGQPALRAFETALRETPLGKPVLFVFDNFETVQSPIALFKWVDTHLRPPNKVLITTRIKDFKATYDIEVSGMLDDEANELVDSESRRLEISHFVDHKRRKELVDRANGHPYIIKVLLGEVARRGKWVNVERMVADQDSILIALFERTYNHLSPLAKRVFLTACQWRSTTPVLAFKMIMLRNASENLDVQRAVDELTRSSLIEIISSRTDEQDFVIVPLAAAIFGRNKLSVEAINSTVLADVELLKDFGAAHRSTVNEGISPRITRFFSNIQGRIKKGTMQLEESVAMLEFAAHYYPQAWGLIADLYKSSQLVDSTAQEREALRRYLQTEPQEKAAIWARIANLAKQEGSAHEEAHAWHEYISQPGLSYQEVSNAAHRVTTLITAQRFMPGREEKDSLLLGIASIMKERLSEASATDCSRLAWLYVKANDWTSALAVTKYGLTLDESNEHLTKLSEQPFYTENQ